MGARHPASALVMVGVGVGLLAALAMACSAIVAGQLNETNDFSQDASTKGEKVFDRCSLLGESPTNDCASCIQDSCREDVAYACNAADGGIKPWFRNLQLCAQNPFKGSFGTTGTYDCDHYDKPDASLIIGTDDSARERASELCVRNKCLNGGSQNGGTPYCKLCPVSVKKPGSTGERVTLETSRCGGCIKQYCGSFLVRCCQSSIVDDIVSKCGFPEALDYRQTCLSLGDPLPDAGPPKASASTEEKCDYDIRLCFLSNCHGTSDCQ